MDVILGHCGVTSLTDAEGILIAAEFNMCVCAFDIFRILIPLLGYPFSNFIYYYYRMHDYTYGDTSSLELKKRALFGRAVSEPVAFTSRG